MGARRVRLVLAATVLAAAALGLIVAGLTSGGDGGGRASAAAPASSAADPHPVARGFKPDGTTVASCHEALCFEQAFGNLVFKQGPKAAFKVFDADIAKAGTVQVDCHRIAHRMGAGALLRFKGDV